MRCKRIEVEEKGMDKKKQRMQELVDLLNSASKAYYQDATEIMGNFEYDKLYDELLELEKKLGITMANSPTVNVGYEVLSELPKERHEKPMLSLDKTKEISRLKEFLGDQKAFISPQIFESIFQFNSNSAIALQKHGHLF